MVIVTYLIHPEIYQRSEHAAASMFPYLVVDAYLSWMQLPPWSGIASAPIQPFRRAAKLLSHGEVPVPTLVVGRSSYYLMRLDRTDAVAPRPILTSPLT